MKYSDLKPGDVFRFKDNKYNFNCVVNNDGSYSVLIPSPIKHKNLDPDRLLSKWMQVRQRKAVNRG